MSLLFVDKIGNVNFINACHQCHVQFEADCDVCLVIVRNEVPKIVCEACGTAIMVARELEST